jgi:hypothetical protein
MRKRARIRRRGVVPQHIRSWVEMENRSWLEMQRTFAESQEQISQFIHDRYIAPMEAEAWRNLLARCQRPSA